MSKIYKIYLDVCCLNRTLDDLEQFRIRLEESRSNGDNSKLRRWQVDIDE